MGLRKSFNRADEAIDTIVLPEYLEDASELAEQVYFGYQLVRPMSRGDAVISADNGSFSMSTSESRSFGVVLSQFEQFLAKFSDYPNAHVFLYVYMKNQGCNSREDEYQTFETASALRQKIPRERWPSVATMGIAVR